MKGHWVGLPGTLSAHEEPSPSASSTTQTVGLNGRLCSFLALFAGFFRSTLPRASTRTRSSSRELEKVGLKAKISGKSPGATAHRVAVDAVVDRPKTGRFSAVRASPSLVLGSIEPQHQETRLGRLGMSRGARKGPRDKGSRSRAPGDSSVPGRSVPHHHHKGGSASPSCGPRPRGLPGPAPARGLAPTCSERP